MTQLADAELTIRGVHAQWKSALWWTLGIVGLALVTVAFWPSIEGSGALSELEQSLSPDVLAAFGAQNLSTPAGYLDGQLYALLLPLLLSGLAIGAATALTSGEEDAGRLELIHALPVSRQAVWVWRFVSVLIVLTIVTGVAIAAVVGTRGLFSLEEVTAARLVEATVACALLAVFHGAVAYAVGGLGGPRGVAVSASILVLLAGYVVNFLFPLSDSLADLRRISPWWWAIGEQPVSNGVDGFWLGVLGGVTLATLVIGTVGVVRRDIRPA
jgi:ABC-2 type transport system permease protein